MGRAVDAHHDLIGTLSSYFTNNDGGALRMGSHLGSGRSEKKTLEATVSSRSHHDQLGVFGGTQHELGGGPDLNFDDNVVTGKGFGNFCQFRNCLLAHGVEKIHPRRNANRKPTTRGGRNQCVRKGESAATDECFGSCPPGCIKGGGRAIHRYDNSAIPRGVIHEARMDYSSL